MKMIIFLLVLLPLCCSNASATVTPIESLVDLSTHAGRLDAGTLVVLDIDQTLTASSEPAFQHPTFAKHLHVAKSIAGSWTPVEKNVITNLMMLTSGTKLIEDNTANAIRDLQRRGVKVIALTGSLTGSVSEIVGPVPERRHNQLLSLGIDLSSSLSKRDTVIFDQFPEYLGGHPVFSKGILCANGDSNSKGEVLLAFFDKIGWTPPLVVFIDDVFKNVEDMDSALSETGIEHVCFHYLGAKNLAAEDISTEYLQDKWLSVERQAKDLLTQRSVAIEHSSSN